MAVGNVGETLKPYKECDTFLSRDAGFTWEEIHKDAHMWEFGDSGSILVIVNDEGPTDHVLFSTDEGMTWKEYQFYDEKIRVDSIVTVNEDDSRRFILFGKQLRNTGAVAIHIDFSALTLRQCEFWLFPLTRCGKLNWMQVYSTQKTPTTMISSSGDPVSRERNAVCLVDK